MNLGSVPALYREVYDILSPNQEHVDHEMFIKLLVKSSLPKSTLSQVRIERNHCIRVGICNITRFFPVAISIILVITVSVIIVTKTF